MPNNYFTYISGPVGPKYVLEDWAGEQFETFAPIIDENGEATLNGFPIRGFPVEETEETVVAIAILTFLFFLILVVGFLILNRRLSVKLWQPFRNTLASLKTFNLNTQSNIFVY